jgi:hypothetical protein
VTDREIVKALHWCARRDCRGCPNGPAKAGCIYDLKIAAADAIEKLLHKVFVAENKDRLCRYNSVVICDWPEERPGRCRSCPGNPERTEWECEA